MNKKSMRGFTLIEVLAALAIGAMMMLGLSELINNSLDDVKAQQTAAHQAQVTSAAAQYIKDKYTDLVASATATNPAKITVEMLRDAKYLSSNFELKNAYGQTPCVLVLEPDTNKLDALVVTEGGNEIPAKSISYVAANAGQGGGYITSTDGGITVPIIAVGAYGSSKVSNAKLTLYRSLNCSGTAASEGRLASMLFYGGPGSLTTDFLYRNTVPGHPELNTMATPLHLPNATDNTTDANCLLSNPSTLGGVVVNSAGEILSCQSGFWRRQGYMRDRAADYGSLPPTGNSTGDVRVTEDKSRAFIWDGSKWNGLAVDGEGKLTTDTVQFEKVVTRGDECPSIGLVARDENGITLSCQKFSATINKWQSQAQVELGYSDNSCQRIVPSIFLVPDDVTNCATIFPSSSIYYVAADNTYYAIIERPVTATKDGLISVNVWSQMNRQLVSNPSVRGQLEVFVDLLDSGYAVLASTRAQSPAFTNSTAGVNVSLSKSVQKADGAYIVRIKTGWSLLSGGTMTYNQANYSSYGVTYQQTPVMTGWNIDLFY